MNSLKQSCAESQLARFETSAVEVGIYVSAAQIPAELRSQAFRDELKDFRYHVIAAETLAEQFGHRFLVLKNKQTGQSVLQPVFIADQDLLEGLPNRLNSILVIPRKIFPRWLKSRMLFAGCSAGSGAVDCAEPWVKAAIREVMMIYARQVRAAIILFKDFPAKYRPVLEPFLLKGDYRRVPSMPGCVLHFDFASFEEFMSARLGRKLRYKYIKLNKQAPVPWEVITDVSSIANEIHALYLQTHNRSKMRFERLPPEFFIRIGRELPDRARFFIWRVNGKIAAFALCLVHDGVMEHLNIGFDYAVAFDRQLYYVTIRDLFRWAISQNLKRYETGQLNYDPKLHLQMKLAPLDLYARHVSPWLNPFFKLALGFLQPVRHEPILQQFPNVAEL